MIQITQLKLPVSHNERMLREKVAKNAWHKTRRNTGL